MKKVLLILFITSFCASCSNNAESKTEVKTSVDSGSKKIDSPKMTTEPAHGMIPPGDSANGRRPRD